MPKLPLFKIGFVSALAVLAFASSEIAFETSPVDDRAADAKQASQHRGFDMSGKVSLSDAELAQTHARPLFSPDRRPFVAKPPVIEQPVVTQVAMVDQPVTAPRRLQLLGTNVAGSVASVLVRNRESEEVRWLKVGDSFDGWALTTAAADGAVFVCHPKRETDCEYRLPLYADEGGQ